MAQLVCDRCGCNLDDFTDVGAVNIAEFAGVDLYGCYVFCPECTDIIRKMFREMRFKAIVTEDK